jgi:hypothetical protein
MPVSFVQGVSQLQTRPKEVDGQSDGMAHVVFSVPLPVKLELEFARAYGEVGKGTD